MLPGNPGGQPPVVDGQTNPVPPDKLAAATEVTKTTRVIMSFGTRTGGIELVSWLWWDIMLRYGASTYTTDPSGRKIVQHHDRSFCYLDAASLKDRKSTRL